MASAGRYSGHSTCTPLVYTTQWLSAFQPLAQPSLVHTTSNFRAKKARIFSLQVNPFEYSRVAHKHNIEKIYTSNLSSLRQKIIPHSRERFQVWPRENAAGLEAAANTRERWASQSSPRAHRSATLTDANYHSEWSWTPDPSSPLTLPFPRHSPPHPKPKLPRLQSPHLILPPLLCLSSPPTQAPHLDPCSPPSRTNTPPLIHLDFNTSSSSSPEH